MHSAVVCIVRWCAQFGGVHSAVVCIVLQYYFRPLWSALHQFSDSLLFCTCNCMHVLRPVCSTSGAWQEH